MGRGARGAPGGDGGGTVAGRGGANGRRRRPGDRHTSSLESARTRGITPTRPSDTPRIPNRPATGPPEPPKRGPFGTPRWRGGSGGRAKLNWLRLRLRGRRRRVLLTDDVRQEAWMVQHQSRKRRVKRRHRVGRVRERALTSCAIGTVPIATSGLCRITPWVSYGSSGAEINGHATIYTQESAFAPST